MLLADDVSTTTGAALITAIGVIVVAVIGLFTAKFSSDARKKSEEASSDVKGYLEALKAKDEFIDSLERRIKSLEEERNDLLRRLDTLEKNNRVRGGEKDTD